MGLELHSPAPHFSSVVGRDDVAREKERASVRVSAFATTASRHGLGLYI